MIDIEAKARELIPTIQARVADMEQQRRLPADLARTMAQAGLYRMTIPQDLGGLECAPQTLLRTIATVAQADASVGWCLMIGVTSALYSAYLPIEIARSIYSDPELITGGVFAALGRAQREGDHYRVDGHWRWASGSHNCKWLNGGCVLIEDGAPRTLANGMPESRSVIVPIEDVELIDTWHTMGLVGTGSVDMKMSNVLVPIARTVSLAFDKPRAPGPLYVFPAFGLLAAGIAAVALGNARAALDDFAQFASGAKTAGSRRILAERATVQQEFAQAEATLRGAGAMLFEAVEQAWNSAQRDGQIPLQQRAGLRLAATHLTRQAALVCRSVHDLAGGAAVFLSNDLQRRLRDAQTMTAHMMISPATYELAGRVLFGLPTDDTMV